MKFINYIFYCIYVGVGAKTRNEKKKSQRQQLALQCFCVMLLFYTFFLSFLAIAMISLSLINIFPLYITFIIIGAITALIFVIPHKYFTQKKVRQIDNKWNGTVTRFKGRVVMLLLSLPIVAIVAWLGNTR